VRACVLDIDRARGIADVSMRRHLVTSADKPAAAPVRARARSMRQSVV
jgi:hypothetical protein